MAIPMNDLQFTQIQILYTMYIYHIPSENTCSHVIEVARNFTYGIIPVHHLYTNFELMFMYQTAPLPHHLKPVIAYETVEYYLLVIKSWCLFLMAVMNG